MFPSWGCCLFNYYLIEELEELQELEEQEEHEELVGLVGLPLILTEWLSE
jgi:hypothetical protein